MKKQYGAIGAGAIAALSIFGIAALIVGTGLSMYYSAYNYGADSETTIPAEYKNMENILGQYSLKVSEAVQLPAMHRDDMKDVMTSVMTARQGSGGSKAAFQWFKEHNIDMPPTLYTKVQQIIEAGRNKFENSQTKFIDTKRGYAASLKKDLFLSRGWWLAIGGYPTINLDDYKIISSGHAVESFKTGIDTGLKLR